MHDPTMMSIYDAISPVDSRYIPPKEIHNLLSDAGFLRAKLRVELALVEELNALEMCSDGNLAQIREACEAVTPEEVAKEEEVTKHDIQAMVNCIKSRVADGAKKYVHWMMTSYDVVDTANALRYKEAIQCLKNLLFDLRMAIHELALREADTPMIGRTHGQQAMPITCGFWLIGYVDRLDDSIRHIESMLKTELKGKLSGAVGSYNASLLVMKDPITFEGNVLRRLGLKPGLIATQIVPPEGMIRIFNEITLAVGIIADLANDIRQLQRTEIAELGEEFAKGQVGSSAMPHKKNPIGFENAVSIWKMTFPKMVPMYISQISEHQRDLTSSASSRAYGETIALVAYVTMRMTGLMKKMWVNRERMLENIRSNSRTILSEALRTLLAKYGHPQGHEVVQRLVQDDKQALYLSAYESVKTDLDLKPYLDKMTESELAILKDPTKYIGLAPDLARRLT